jgi:hypothetical protein
MTFGGGHQAGGLDESTELPDRGLGAGDRVGRSVGTRAGQQYPVDAGRAGLRRLTVGGPDDPAQAEQ